MYPDVLGVRYRRVRLYYSIINNLNYIINSNYGQILKIVVPNAASPALAQPV